MAGLSFGGAIPSCTVRAQLQPAKSPISYTGFCGSNIKLQKLNSGNIICLYRDEDPENRGVSVSVSKDGGENWNYYGQLYSAPNDAKHLPYYKCGYPDLTYLNKTDILGVLHTYPDENHCIEIHQFIIRDRSQNQPKYTC